MLTNILEHVDNDLPSAIDRLKEFIRIKSISTDPAFANDCRKAAEWIAADLRSIGFQAKICPTPGHPIVVAHSPPAEKQYLFYGHYDVQPVDPIGLWTQDPFEPIVEETSKGKVIRGRGASDDKGQLMTFVEACRAWKAVEGKLPDGLLILLEGEEESGSPSLVPFLKANSTELSCDLALICDTGLFGNDTPAIVTTLRGLLAEEFIITGPDRDLHSGMYGGIGMNPIRVATKIIAGLHDSVGRITIPGFYEGVQELTAENREQWNTLTFDHSAFLGDVGLSMPAGEVNRTPLEQMWSRPTCDVNGIRGGYSGNGFKTVLPSKATVKLSFRLVGQQDPVAIQENFRAYVRRCLPEDCSVEFTDHSMGPSSRMSTDHSVFALAQAALTDEWKKPAVYIGCGGSIPIVAYFQTILGMDSLLVGFGRDDDHIHSPNEKYNVECFHKGIRSWARILSTL